jgi:hypothetical protein
MGVKGTKHLTKADFEFIKALQERGATIEDIKRLSGKAAGTLSLVHISACFKEYKEKRYLSNHPQQPAQKPEPMLDVVPDPVPEPADACSRILNNIYDKIDGIDTRLSGIDTNLKWLSDHAVVDEHKFKLFNK